jgi:hypothetical protein
MRRFWMLKGAIYTATTVLTITNKSYDNGKKSAFGVFPRKAGVHLQNQ